MRETLRLCFMGSVDDGKSTLIGRLLVDTDSLYQDQTKALASGNGIELSWVTDGLLSEREQGITIDVAYRHFASAKRDYLIADVPGHEAHTKNMMSGASFADAGILLLDASRGTTAQTYRHLAIADLAGIRTVIFAVNKMDLVSFSQARFNEIREEILAHVKTLGFSEMHFIPVAGLTGDGVVTRSSRMPWYQGSSLLEEIENLRISQTSGALRLSVQAVLRAEGRRYYAGRVASGSVRAGHAVKLQPSGRRATIHSVFVGGVETASAAAGVSVAVRFTDEVDLSRGEMIVDDEIASVNVVDARIAWLGRQSLRVGDRVFVRHGTLETKATVEEIFSRLGLPSFAREDIREVSENDIAFVRLRLVRAVPADTKSSGAVNARLVLVDSLSFATIGAGRIESIPSASETRTPKSVWTVWMTGLPGAGKSTLAEALHTKWMENERQVVILDGDRVRAGLCRDLGFSEVDRAENMRRVSEVCKMLNESGVSVIVALISPLEAERTRARDTIGRDRYVEVFVDAPLEVCRRRDPKGLYAKADRGELKNLTGVGAPYDRPTQPNLHLRTGEMSVGECVEALEKILL